MKSTLKNAVVISSVYVGTVLGAGFASGQEMMKFFAYYGCKGMFGLLLTGMLFGIISYMVLTIVYQYKCKSYIDFMNLIVGENLRKYLDSIVMIFMFVCFCAMFAGCGALFKQHFHLPYYIGVSLIAIGCFLTFIFEVKGILTINTILAPFLLVGTLVIGIYIWYDQTTLTTSIYQNTFSLVKNNWITSSIIYVAYNCITAIVVLASIGELLNENITAVLSSILGGVSLGVIGIVLGIVLLTNYNEVINYEIPLLAIIVKYSELIQYIYILLIFSAMFTTAVANGFGLIDMIKKSKPYLRKHHWTVNLLIVLSAVLFSGIGFSNMVGRVYPIFGYLGIFQLLCIVLYYFKSIFSKNH